ncbi:uncharacterized protein LOC130629987 [Hydractinia symbiolongicarpus]|uniref:uncharacterized protein LOC130629987 n=1 Tax=Hydractinia symbiolongicarpus TaxID=13093 RepID=UPI00254C19FB|nr:uncharacterized protein LOC130629987 [Hydractinia symbiolongicarpus]
MKVVSPVFFSMSVFLFVEESSSNVIVEKLLYKAIIRETREELGCLKQNIKSIRGLFSKIDLDNIKYMLIPYNDGGTHWILTVVDVKSGSIIVLDPMRTDYNPNLKSHSDAVTVAMKILQKKFWKNLANISIKTEEHVMQKDARSCGVYYCFYASKIMSGGKLTDNCDPLGFRIHIYIRRYIYKTIVGCRKLYIFHLHVHGRIFRKNIQCVGHV